MDEKHLEKHVDTAAKHAGGILRSRYGLWGLAAISFFESALPVPIITDPFLAAYILADKAKYKKAVLVAIITSVVGGIFAYVLAFAFYEYIISGYLNGALGEQFFSIVEQFQNGMFLLTILGALTPVPYTLVALAAGFVEASLFTFIIASIIGRGIRYSIVGYLTYRFGEPALALARKRIWMATAVVILALILYAFLKL